MPNMNTQPEDGAQEGLRERKRRDTLQRIAQTGLDLFIVKGYEATTLDDIAAAAGISRRTFFHYFTSKDEILLAWQVGLADAVRGAVLEASTDQSPLEALFGALQKLASNFDAETAIDVARVLRSSEQLRAANHAKFMNLENAAFEALCQRWPQRAFRGRLRMVAMAGLGAFRVAIDEWTDKGGKEPLTRRIEKAFENLHSAVQ
ncbi:TetR/AcrR family transcriptional regulator [Ralstonia pseudosolanacearum]|uniref:TetR/AcrR family transcriptional regulator n=1 Tax=Ralstonia pseudosolanacearum TaxID=1310165 RepID=UPI0008D97CBE|nr:TetR/AcrR family transcriptional regulator [Ralstonia pseudosolanacearum]AZU56979.1 TetR family transcriptional regulator [Ralstonia solanacearum]MCK4136573.1 TetR family transcriptional regulator [Ralstonia pseudosolanacearum]MCK4150936.1 TetR family transcriptional regulator [Ralstonia pseudosolanacearum]OHV02388.1 TetR family transcriptional regulator [Ralstonia solanacearum]QIK19492.1 TetR family transcriptional regulator [Ralstonia solanacearum]